MNKLISVIAALLLVPLSFAQQSDSLTGTYVNIDAEKTVSICAGEGTGSIRLATGCTSGTQNTIVFDGTTGGLTGLKLANNTYLKARNAANTADLDLLKAGSNDRTILNSGVTINFSIADTAEWALNNSTLTPAVTNTENIGSTTIAVGNTFTRNVQADTANNLTLSARNGHIDFYSIAADSTPLKRWRVDASTGALQSDLTNGAGIALFKSGANMAPIVNGFEGDIASISSDVTVRTSTHSGLMISQTATASETGVFIGNGADANGPSLSFFKTRATTPQVNADTIVASGDSLGRLVFWGADGASYLGAARIEAVVDATPGTNDMPTRLVFMTTTDASASATTKWTMDNAGGFIGAGTGTIGWSAVNAANQACTTTCTTPCVFGMNTGALGNFVGCADATADTCICAGAS